MQPIKARLEAIAMILDRTEGKPAQSIALTAQATASALPPGWDDMTSTERAAWLDQHMTPQLTSGR